MSAIHTSSPSRSTFALLAAVLLAAPLAASAEPAVCTGLTDKDREILARLPTDLVERVQPLNGPAEDAEATAAPQESLNLAAKPAVLRGAALSVRPVSGLSAERLQRIVECGLTRAAVPQSDWPVVTPATSVRVRSGGDSFVVQLWTKAGKDAQEVLAAAQKLQPRS